MANGSDSNRFHGSLPGGGVRRAGPARQETGVYRDVQGRLDQAAGAQRAVIAGFNYATHPVEYVTAAGMRPRSDVDRVALVKYPQLALHAVAGSVGANAQMQLSNGRSNSITHHATLGMNYPADAKASFSMARVLDPISNPSSHLE